MGDDNNMRASEEMLSYRVPPEERGFYELASAIVNVAVKDYRRCRRYNLRETEKIRQFFLSEVFENISMVENPNVFLKMLDDQIDAELKSGIRRKREKQSMKCNR